MLGDVSGQAGQFEVGAVDHGAFAAAFLRTHQVLEALAVQAAAVVFLACSGNRGWGERGGVGLEWGRGAATQQTERSDGGQKEKQVTEERQERWR